MNETYTRQEQLELLAGHVDNLPASDMQFANSLVYNYRARGGLSEKQWEWVEKLAMRAIGKATYDEDYANYQSNSMELPKVREMFNIAARDLKHPSIKLQTANSGVIKLTLAGANSKYAGQINVTDGKQYPDNKFFGRIDSNGKMLVRSDLPEDVKQLLISLNENPKELARLHGQKYNNCCFCGRELLEADSIAAGYGPICAEKWGLPHAGMKEVKQHEDLQDANKLLGLDADSDVNDNDYSNDIPF